jgi:mono/diheme cytochrome c family protein
LTINERSVQLQILLGLLIAVATVALLAFTFNQEEARLARTEQAQRAQSIEVGADLYEIHCRSCHGTKGEGAGQLGPPLSDAPFFTTRLAEVAWQTTLEDYVIAATTTGRVVATRPLYAGDGIVAVMSPWSDRFGGPLSDDQIRAVTDYVLNWEATALGEVELTELEMPEASADDPEVIARGQQLFVAHCGQCHALAGLTQGEIGPDLTDITQVAPSRKPELTPEEYIRESFLIPNAYVVAGYEPEPEGVGENCGGVLSEQQLDEIVVFMLAGE